MVTIKNRTLCLSGEDDNEIKIDIDHIFWDTYLRVYLTKNRDTFVTVGEDQKESYEALETFFDSVMQRYSQELEDTKKCKYEKVYFVDIYNKVITFYSDHCPATESHALSFRKREENNIKSFEVNMFYNRASRSTNHISLDDDSGQYINYIEFLSKLYYSLLEIALEDKDNYPSIETYEIDKETGVMRRVRE